jgi:glycosyltransferase involved in cell wall biosynthesis
VTESLIDRLKPSTICFWNVDARLKLLLVKVLSARTLRFIDVSPGPMMFHEMERSVQFAQRIAFDPAAYFRRLDLVVHKYQNADVPSHYGDLTDKTRVIPNGVPSNSAATQHVPLLSPKVDRDKAVVVCSRIVPNKCLETVLEVAKELVAIVPEGTITIVGGVDERHISYWERLKKYKDELGLADVVHFAGPHPHPPAFLRQFRAFLMLSRQQGCPNASLEALATGVPVIANDDGGTSEQIQSDVTGVLVPLDNPKSIAQAIARVLLDRDYADRLSEAGVRHIDDKFSMSSMVQLYEAIFWPSDPIKPHILSVLRNEELIKCHV